MILRLLTEHGPWEGIKGRNQEVIRFQTTAHTLALVLGLLGTGSDHMKAYLESRGDRGRLDEIFKAGESQDFLSNQTQVFAWNGKESPMQSRRQKTGFRATTDRIQNAGIAFVPGSPHGADLSGGLLVLGYHCSLPVGQATITLKPEAAGDKHGLIPTEIFTSFDATGTEAREISIPLPATPGLARIKELVITFGPASQNQPLDLNIGALEVKPISAPSRAGNSTR